MYIKATRIVCIVHILYYVTHTFGILYSYIIYSVTSPYSLTEWRYVLQHGMGMPSVGILLHEMIKLMYHARVKNPTFFRLGTCGGIGIDGGNLVITESAVDGLMNPYLEQVRTMADWLPILSD